MKRAKVVNKFEKLIIKEPKNFQIESLNLARRIIKLYS